MKYIKKLKPLFTYVFHYSKTPLIRIIIQWTIRLSPNTRKIFNGKCNFFIMKPVAIYCFVLNLKNVINFNNYSSQAKNCLAQMPSGAQNTGAKLLGKAAWKCCQNSRKRKKVIASNCFTSKTMAKLRINFPPGNQEK